MRSSKHAQKLHDMYKVSELVYMGVMKPTKSYEMIFFYFQNYEQEQKYPQPNFYWKLSHKLKLCAHQEVHFHVEYSKLIHAAWHHWKSESPPEVFIHSNIHSNSIEFTTFTNKMNQILIRWRILGWQIPPMRYCCHHMIPCNFINHHDYICTETIPYLKQNEYAVFFPHRVTPVFLMPIKTMFHCRL